MSRTTTFITIDRSVVVDRQKIALPGGATTVKVTHEEWQEKCLVDLNVEWKAKRSSASTAKTPDGSVARMVAGVRS